MHRSVFQIFTLMIFLVGQITFANTNLISFHRQLTADDTEARQLVEVDLLQLQSKEVEETNKRIPKNLTQLQRINFIENDFKEKNKKLFAKLAAAPSVNKSGSSENKALGISETQAQEVFRMFKEHPVIGDQAAAKYDTPSRQIGFCFGRAAFVHSELLRRGVSPSSLGKIFAIGDLLYKEKGWKFHVATIVRNASGGWFVIDALQEKILTPENWAKEISNFSPENGVSPLRFYLTDPIKFRPLPGAYTTASLSDPIYKGYFLDLEKWFDEHPIAENERFDR